MKKLALVLCMTNSLTLPADDSAQAMRQQSIKAIYEYQGVIDSILRQVRLCEKHHGKFRNEQGKNICPEIHARLGLFEQAAAQAAKLMQEATTQAVEIPDEEINVKTKGESAAQAVPLHERTIDPQLQAIYDNQEQILEREKNQEVVELNEAQINALKKAFNAAARIALQKYCLHFQGRFPDEHVKTSCEEILKELSRPIK